MYGIQAKKHLWQNFLRNTKIIETIVGEESIDDTYVIEVWSGPGDLTAELYRRRPRGLIMIELDDDMIPLLTHRFLWESWYIYHRDALRVDVVCGEYSPPTSSHIEISRETIIRVPRYSVYGNIPYYITSPILQHFLYDVSLAPEAAIFSMLKEVADRILARDGRHSVLSLSCQLVAGIEKICDIHPNNFVPAPKVWSTCLRFTLLWHDRAKAKKILWLVKLWFSQKRKKLLTNLSQNVQNKQNLILAFEELWFSGTVRAEELSIAEWYLLFEKLYGDS